MNTRLVAYSTFAVFLAAGTAAAAEPVLMSPEWAKQACEAWNADSTLTEGLTKWIENDKGRGFKVIDMFRIDCPDSPRVELRFNNKDGKAMCVYGGAVETKNLDLGADYIMSATTSRWLEMGKGEYGPMKAMMFGRLKFEGPKLEAMGNMGPFGSFLLIVGKVPSDSSTCPK
jgi:putative sterol carrier protein